MTVLHEDLQIKDFTMPSGIEVLTYCTKTGLIATEACKKTDTGVYKTVCKPGICTCGTTPVQPDDTTTSTTTPTGDATTTDGTGTTDTTGTTDATESTTVPVEGTTLPTTGTTDTTAAPVTPGDDGDIPTP